MRLALVLREKNADEHLTFMRQIGVQAVAANPPCDPEKGYYERDALLDLKRRIESHGLKFESVGTPPWHLCYKWMLGLPDRDEQIEKLQKGVRNLGAAGVPVLIYNIHALRYYRTPGQATERGGALGTRFDMTQVKDAPLMVAGGGMDINLIPESHRRPISDDEMWENLTYFLKAMVPVAEEAGVNLALHPDDPPVPSIAGVARIMRSPEAFRRAIEIVPSPRNGLKFCVGCFSEMSVDVAEEIRYFGNLKKIFFVDFRNVRGTADNFSETFPDDGKENMFEIMKAFKETGYDGAISPDHALRIAGDAGDRRQYWAYAIGHMRGLIQGLD